MENKHLENALLLEQNGHAFYEELSRNASSRLSKTLFASLAEQEVYHIEIIKSFAQSASYQHTEFVPLESMVKQIFQELGTPEQLKDISQIDGIQKAIQMEKDGFAAYQTARDQAQDSNTQAFFQFLMDMEDEHYEALANLYYYYAENDKWLAEDESRVWSWMNT